jgi:hypothetical protein
MLTPVGADMRRREFISLLGGTVAAWPLAVRAQQASRPHRIGLLTRKTDASVAAQIDAFRQGLRDLGWVEGKAISKVPFRSGTELANTMLANSTPIGGLGVSNIVSYLESGRVIGLAVSSSERRRYFPIYRPSTSCGRARNIRPPGSGSLRRQERRARSWKRSPTSPERFSLRPASATRSKPGAKMMQHELRLHDWRRCQ